jgi:hypothetical protein
MIRYFGLCAWMAGAISVMANQAAQAQPALEVHNTINCSHWKKQNGAWVSDGTPFDFGPHKDTTVDVVAPNTFKTRGPNGVEVDLYNVVNLKCGGKP